MKYVSSFGWVPTNRHVPASRFFASPLHQSCIKAHIPPNVLKPAPIQVPEGSAVAYVSVRFRGWHFFLLGCSSRRAFACCRAGRQKKLSCIKAHGNKDEPQGLTKAHRQRQKTGYSPWELPQASRALGGAIRIGMGLVSWQRRRASGYRT